MVHSIGDRVGEDEFHELEHRGRTRKGTKKSLKGNDHEAAGESQEQQDHGSEWPWMIFIICVVTHHEAQAHIPATFRPEP